MNENTELPREIIVSANRSKLSIMWADGRRTDFSATFLRNAGRSSDAVRAGLDGKDPHLNSRALIASVKPVGRYAVNIVFTDGYDRGIYPWSYLGRLKPAAAPPNI